MSAVMYFFSVMVTLAAYAVGIWILWQGVELAYWIYCKATGRTY